MKKICVGMAPARFVFIDPDTGHEYKAFDLPALMRQIIAYREQNRLPEIEALPLVVQNYLCGLPENVGICEDVTIKRTWGQYLKGGVALLQDLWLKPEDRITPDEAEDRAQICLDCPENVFPDKEGFLKWSDDIAERSLGGATTPSAPQLGNCQVCSCPLRVKIFFRGPFKISDEEKKKYPSFCWQIRE